MTNTPGDLQSRAPIVNPASPVSAVPPAAALRARERLATAIVAACRPRPDGNEQRATLELRSSVGDYIAALRDDGATVEHAVISTKVQTSDGRWYALDARYYGAVVINAAAGRYFEPAPPRNYLIGLRIPYLGAAR